MTGQVSAHRNSAREDLGGMCLEGLECETNLWPPPTLSGASGTFCFSVAFQLTGVLHSSRETTKVLPREAEEEQKNVSRAWRD